MHSALHLLADLGAASVDTVWLPILVWTALAVVVDGALRLGRPSARMGLGVRGALLALLPALLAVPPLLARWVPSLRADLPPVPAIPPTSAASPAALAVPVEAPVALAPPLTPWIDLALGLGVVLAVASALLALGVLIGGVRWLHRYRRTLGAAAASVVSDARALAEAFGVRGTLEVAVAEPASSPFTMGWRRPVVAVPSDLSGELLHLALAHEIAHVREAHYEWSLAERVVRALFVWHPLVHVLGRGLTLDRERSADAAVLRLWPDRARSYGHLLHAFASRPSPALALGASSSPLLHRLHAMTRLRPDRPRLAALVGALVLAVPLLLAASAVPDPVDPAPREAGVAAADTFDTYIDTRRVRNRNGDVRMELELRPGTSRAMAETIADYYADGDEPGDLLVTGDGIRIERSGLRVDAYTPPPPPPPAPDAPSAPEPPRAPEPLDEPAPPRAPEPLGEPAPPSPPTEPRAPRPAPPSPPTTPEPPSPPTDRQLEGLRSQVEALEGERVAVQSRLQEARRLQAHLQEVRLQRVEVSETERARVVAEQARVQTEQQRLETRTGRITEQHRHAQLALDALRLERFRQVERAAD